MQDKSMIMNAIAYQRLELESALSKARDIEAEISRLEDELCNMGERMNNPKACLNPIAFARKKCEECVFYGRCSYEGKSDYGRFKL